MRTAPPAPWPPPWRPGSKRCPPGLRRNTPRPKPAARPATARRLGFAPGGAHHVPLHQLRDRPRRKTGGRSRLAGAAPGAGPLCEPGTGLDFLRVAGQNKRKAAALALYALRLTGLYRYLPNQEEDHCNENHPCDPAPPGTSAAMSSRPRWIWATGSSPRISPSRAWTSAPNSATFRCSAATRTSIRRSVRPMSASTWPGATASATTLPAI